MTNSEVTQKYFDAWNKHQPNEVVKLFAEGGTYQDSATVKKLSGLEIVGYVENLIKQSPDVSFEIVSEFEMGDHHISAEWLMKGTMNGQNYELPGADFIEFRNGKIIALTGYFDPQGIPKQLGMNVIVQPKSAGPFKFGTSVLVSSGKILAPKEIGITFIEPKGIEGNSRNDHFAQKVMEEMQSMNGFLGGMFANIGGKAYTITSWENEGDSQLLMRDGIHKEAVSTFFSEEIADFAMTSVSLVNKIKMFVRCSNCKRMENYLRDTGLSVCGSKLDNPHSFI